MMKKSLLGILICTLCVGLIGCGGGDAELDNELFGYWFECDYSGAVYIDDDDYGWGFQIAADGVMTTARLDFWEEIIELHTSPFGRLLKAHNGQFKVDIDGEGTSKGSYSITRMTSDEGYNFSMLNLSGSAAAGYYLKLANL